MTEALKLCMREWQFTELSAVLNFLHNPKWDDPSAETGSILPIPNKNVINKRVKANIERLNSADNENLEDVEIMPCESSMKVKSDNRTYNPGHRHSYLYCIIISIYFIFGINTIQCQCENWNVAIPTPW